MKGIVFREFLEMVESTFGDEMSEKLVEDNDLASGGISVSYTHLTLPTICSV